VSSSLWSSATTIRKVPAKLWALSERTVRPINSASSRAGITAVMEVPVRNGIVGSRRSLSCQNRPRKQARQIWVASEMAASASIENKSTGRYLGEHLLMCS
jgi:hypothetical protein